MRRLLQLGFVLLLSPIFGQEGHYPSNPVVWHGDFTDDYSLCVMNRNYEIAALGNLKNDIPHGKWIYFTKDSIVQTVGEYRMGLKHGYWICYDEHGNIQSSGMYKNGKLHGKWAMYDTFLVYKKGERLK